MIDDPSMLSYYVKQLPWQEYFRILTSASKKTPRGENESTMTPSLIVLTELLKLKKNGQFPDETVRIEV